MIDALEKLANPLEYSMKNVRYFLSNNGRRLYSCDQISREGDLLALVEESSKFQFSAFLTHEAKEHGIREHSIFDRQLNPKPQSEGTNITGSYFHPLWMYRATLNTIFKSIQTETVEFGHKLYLGEREFQHHGVYRITSPSLIERIKEKVNITSVL